MFNLSQSSSVQNLSSLTLNNTKRSHTQLDSRKQVIAFQDRVMTINIKEAQHQRKDKGVMEGGGWKTQCYNETKKPSAYRVKGEGAKANNKDNYGEITLFPTLCKIYEMILLNRL